MMNHRRVFLGLLVIILLIQSAASVSASEYTLVIEDALTYFGNAQNSDGGFPSTPGRKSDPDTTSWVLMALAALGEEEVLTTWATNGKSPLDFFRSIDYHPTSTTDYAKMILTLVAVGESHVYNGENLLQTLKSFQQEDGSFYQEALNEQGMVNAHMWSILAIASTGEAIPNKTKATDWLKNAANDDGGYAWFMGLDSDSDDTAVAIETLVMLGEPSTSGVVQDALSYLKTCQLEDGGFMANNLMANEANVASDAWVIQGLAALDEAIDSEKWLKEGNSPMDHLLSLQKSDGSFDWKEGVTASPVKMTAYALTAISEKPYPVVVNADSLPITFTDINEDHQAYSAVAELVAMGVINGYEDGTFRPDNLVTRAEFTTMLMKALGKSTMTYQETPAFEDVTESHWAYGYIARAYSSGYINGRTSAVFDPNGQINGAELVTIAINTLPLEDQMSVGTGAYWYSGDLLLARDLGLVYSGFEAEASATRAQCAGMIVALMDK